MRLDDEQLGYLREGIAVRGGVLRRDEHRHVRRVRLTLALAWFRAYWQDRLKRRDEDEARR